MNSVEQAALANTLRIKNWWALHSLLMFQEFQYRKPNMEEFRIIFDSFNNSFQARAQTGVGTSELNQKSHSPFATAYISTWSSVRPSIHLSLRALPSGTLMQKRLGHVPCSKQCRCVSCATSHYWSTRMDGAKDMGSDLEGTAGSRQIKTAKNLGKLWSGLRRSSYCSCLHLMHM